MKLSKPELHALFQSPIVQNNSTSLRAADCLGIFQHDAIEAQEACIQAWQPSNFLAHFCYVGALNDIVQEYDYCCADGGSGCP